jgi:hypothetical protein
MDARRCESSTIPQSMGETEGEGEAFQVRETAVGKANGSQANRDGCQAIR